MLPIVAFFRSLFYKPPPPEWDDTVVVTRTKLAELMAVDQKTHTFQVTFKPGDEEYTSTILVVNALKNGEQIKSITFDSELISRLTFKNKQTHWFRATVEVTRDLPSYAIFKLESKKR